MSDKRAQEKTRKRRPDGRTVMITGGKDGFPLVDGKQTPPFAIGDVVTLKSGGFRMTIEEVGFMRTCREDDPGYWLANVVFATGETYAAIHREELAADILVLAASSSTVPRDLCDDIPF